MSVSSLAPTRHPFSHPVSDLAKLPIADRLAETRGRVEPGDDRGAPDRESQDSGTVASIRAMSASSWATRSMPFYASEFVGHHPGAPDWIGLESVKLIVRMTRDAFPDFTETIEDVVAEADRVVTRFTSTETHLGALRGLAPTGRRMSYMDGRDGDLSRRARKDRRAMGTLRSTRHGPAARNHVAGVAAGPPMELSCTRSRWTSTCRTSERRRAGVAGSSS